MLSLPQIHKALQGFRLPHSATADIKLYAKILDSCILLKLLREGKDVHHQILKHRSSAKNPVLLEKIVQMYISFGEIENARLVFNDVSRASVFVWNAMIRAYAWNGPFDHAIKLYRRMENSGVKPNKFTFPFVLKACSGLEALEDGIEIHDHAKRSGLESDLYVSTALIDMYMKCGCLNDAHEVFCRMPERDAVSWNAMVAGFALHGMYEETVSSVLEMQKMGKRPNPSTIVALLPVVGQVKSLSQGKSIHAFCTRRHFDDEDVLVNTALLDMYGKSECLVYARRIFENMDIRNEVTWSAIIGGHILCGKMAEALEIFREMVFEGSSIVGSASVASILRACANLADLDSGRLIHSYVIKAGLLIDITVANSLLSMYAKVGTVNDAIGFFNEMDKKDTVSYSAMISGCVQNGNAEEALHVFRGMVSSNVAIDSATMIGIIPACSHLSALQHGKCSHGFITTHGFTLDSSICNALIDMYAKCGRIDIARKVFDTMPKQDVVSWNTIIAGYGIHGLGDEAISLFLKMESAGLVPDDITFICLLSACSHSGLVAQGKHWFCAMKEKYNVVPRMEHFICMVDLLGRGGCLSEAYDFIQSMPFDADVRVWGALLGACRVHKNVELGEEVSKMIQKLGPEGTGSFVVLSNLYSATGRFDEAAQVRIMQRKKGFTKSPGCSWVEIDGTVHAFIGGDRSHPQSSSIYQKLEQLLVEIRKLGYQADTSYALHNVEEEEKEHALVYHSEKLAIAFALNTLRCSQPIFITKNLRVCGDCHSAIKYITLVAKRDITVRDANRFHHFKDGACNCGDFW
ncbi:pentatricopeptide repeat-containing protein [Canna indica]|uniref:Pentatricopeptide repeat-containing protein n=1 Tax=Canna indica TaxID=4628 RepID=A0AAQ3KI97_9LILI|nr:pentatricopeptide repeat-containing protein [Canna indica]